MNFSVSSILAGLIFSSIGLYVLKRGKDRSSPHLLVIGVLLMGYSYLTSNPWMDWGLGAALTYGAWYFREY